MSAAAQQTRARHEPEEREDARNVMLETFEQFVRMLLAQDIEPQLRACFDKLVPPAHKPAPAPADCEHAGDWTKVTAVLRMFAGRRLSEAEHAALSEARLIVNAEMVRTRHELKGDKR